MPLPVFFFWLLVEINLVFKVFPVLSVVFTYVHLIAVVCNITEQLNRGRWVYMDSWLRNASQHGSGRHGGWDFARNIRILRFYLFAFQWIRKQRELGSDRGQNLTLKPCSPQARFLQQGPTSERFRSSSQQHQGQNIQTGGL